MAHIFKIGGKLMKLGAKIAGLRFSRTNYYQFGNGYSLFYDEANDRYVVNSTNNVVIFINALTLEIVGSIPSIGSNRQLGYDPIRNRYFFTNYSANSIEVYDGTSFAFIASFSTPSYNPIGCFYHPPTDSYMITAGNGTLYSVNPSSYAFTPFITGWMQTNSANYDSVNDRIIFGRRIYQMPSKTVIAELAYGDFNVDYDKVNNVYLASVTYGGSCYIYDAITFEQRYDLKDKVGSLGNLIITVSDTQRNVLISVSSDMPFSIITR